MGLVFIFKWNWGGKMFFGMWFMLIECKEKL